MSNEDLEWADPIEWDWPVLDEEPLIVWRPRKWYERRTVTWTVATVVSCVMWVVFLKVVVDLIVEHNA